MAVEFVNVFQDVIEAAEEEFGELNCLIQFNPTVNPENLDGGDSIYGETIFPEKDDPDQRPLVNIGTHLTVADSLEILAHELAHVIDGKPEEGRDPHDQRFYDIFDRISMSYAMLCETKYADRKKV
jgi:hypothetical protein